MKKKKLRDYNRSKPAPVSEGMKCIDEPVGRTALRRLLKGQTSFPPDYNVKVRPAGK